MFKSFSAAFHADSRTPCNKASSLDLDLRELFQKFGGTSFNSGIYRVLCSEEAAQWNLLISGAFPSFSGRIACFGCDWLGRFFALDFARQESGKSAVVMFEPGTGQALEIPCSLVQFHESELIEFQEEALAKSFYDQWRSKGGAAPEISQCVGYKVPLFLGGSDSVENLQLSDLDVYWTVAAQLLQQSRGLPLGTPIRNVKIT